MNKSDLRFVFDRLDMDHVRGCASQARIAWDEHERSFEVGYMPGDGTHYGLVFTVLTPEVAVLGAPGGGSMDQPPATASGCRFDGSYALVTYLQRGASEVVGRTSFSTPAWVEAKFDTGGGSAVALAVLLNEITEASPGWRETMIEQAVV